MKDNNRVFGLDLFRAVAIFLVLIAHTLKLIFNDPISNIVFFYAGLIGVELFFVLSGYLIGSILIKLLTNEQNLGFSTVKKFWIRRWFRTLPNYYLLLFIYAIAEAGLSGLSAFFSDYRHALYFFFLQDSIFQETKFFFGQSWSLEIEEWFYLLFPLAIIALNPKVKKVSKSILMTVALFILLPLLGRCVLALYSNLAWAGIRKFTFARLDCIAFGVLAAYLSSYYPGIWQKNKVKFFITGMILSIPLYLVYYYRFILIYNPAAPTYDSGVFMNTIFFTLLSLAFALFLPFAEQAKTTRHVRFKYVIETISLTSYSLYLVHPLLIGIVLKHFPYLGSTWSFIVIWAASIIISYALYHLFEKPVTQLREKFS